MSNQDDNSKEVLERFNRIKNKFEANSKNWHKKQNISVNLLFEKSYNNLLRNQLINLFDELIKKAENISIILRNGLDFKFWNLLIERINLILKSPIDAKNLGKNDITMARKDFALHKQLKENNSINNLNCKFEVWENGNDIISMLKFL